MRRALLLAMVVVVALQVITVRHLTMAATASHESHVDGVLGSEVIFHNHTYLVHERALLVNELNRTVREYVYIVLPRNGTYVHSVVLKVEPEAIRFERDAEGNVFALVFVEVEPGGRIWVNVTFKVSVGGYNIYLNKSKAMWPPLKIAQVYTRDTIYWNIDNETLRELAYEVAYSDNPLESVRLIARWVQEHLAYEVTGGRKGSDRAIASVGGRLVIKGDCVEAADTFVTLARILGIPARTVYGFLLNRYEEKHWLNFTIREEGMELLTHWGGHMWAQVYIPPWGWIDVEMLEDLREPKIADFSNLHVPFGVEGVTFHGTGLLEFVIPSYLTLQYQEFEFKRGD